MSRKNLIFCTLFLFAFISAGYLSTSPVNMNMEVDDEQGDTNITVLSTPKSSAYDVTQRWNYSSVFYVTDVAVSANGKYMAVATYGSTPRGGNPNHHLFFFNTSAHDGIPLWSYNLGVPIEDIAISWDGKYIAMASGYLGSGFLFNSTVPDLGQNKEFMWEVTLPDGFSDLWVDISANGKLIVFGMTTGGDGKVYVYNNSYPTGGGQDKTNDYLWRTANYEVTASVAISADGKYVVSTHDVSIGKEIYLFNTTDYTPLTEQPPMWGVDTLQDLDSAAISADGYYIAVAGEDCAYLLNRTLPDPGNDKIAVWNASFAPNNVVFKSIDISGDGKHIVTGLDVSAETSVEGSVLLYNNSFTTDNIAWKYMWGYDTEGIVRSASITALGEYIVAGTQYNPDTGDENENTVFLFNNSDYIFNSEHVPEWNFNTSDDVYSVSISGWGNHFAAGGPDAADGRSFLFYHARPIPPALRPYVAGDDDDDDEVEAIPYGNYYLLFAVIGIVTLILIHKRKTIVSKK